jgi:hypothetical protein
MIVECDAVLPGRSDNGAGLIQRLFGYHASTSCQYRASTRQHTVRADVINGHQLVGRYRSTSGTEAKVCAASHGPGQ